MPRKSDELLAQRHHAGCSRRSVLVFGASSVPLALSGSIPMAGGATPKTLDLSAYRLSFSTEFDNPHHPLMRRDGGVFGTRYDGWGGVRTLPNNKELQLYVDPYFFPSPTGTDARGANDAPPGTAYRPVSTRSGSLMVASPLPRCPLRPLRGVLIGPSCRA